MYENILVAFDGSESSKNTLVQAAHVAKESGCNIAAVTVVPRVEDGLGAFGADEVTEFYMSSIGEAVSTLEEPAAACPMVQAIELEGNTHKAIIDVAEERDADLIAVGQKGRSGLGRLLLGSVAARVIGYSPMDVLVVPDNTVLNWNTILLATDGSAYSKSAADKAIQIASHYGSALKVVSVVDVPYEAYGDAPDTLERMEEKARAIVETVKGRAQEFNVKAETFVMDGVSQDRIIELAEEQQANVIVMGSHGRTGLARLLMGSVTEKVIGHAPCPVLVVKTTTLG
ncbi:MAG: universal stress protein [Candidatus Aquicultor sp.]